MASATTSTIYITSARYARGYVEAWVSSQTDTTATIYWRILCQQKSAALYGQVANCYVDGIGRGSCSGYITSSSSSWKDVCSTSGYTTVNKTTTSRNASVTVQTRVQPVNGYGSVTSGYVEATCYVSISAKTSYTVAYNANGGSGAPSSQTKWYDTALTLSSTVPTRTGYSFLGWGTSASDTTVDYAAGATYSENAAISLYAIWKADTYTVAYNANGGSGAPSSQTKTYDVDLTLSSTVPTRTNHNFLGWSTSASATTIAYAAGATYSANSAVTLYAIWELAYWKPKITKLTATRCDSDGTANEYGTYAKITFGWELCQLLGANETATIAISWSDGSTSVTGSSTSGTVSKVVGSGALSIDSSHTFDVTVTDNTDSSLSTVSVSASTFPIDFKAGGTGVAFGKPASEDGVASAWDIALDNDKYYCATNSDGNVRSIAGINSLDNAVFAYDSYINSEGSVYYYGNNVYLRSRNNVQTNCPIRIPNAKSYEAANADGTYRSLALVNSSGNTYFGHGSYTNSEGSTYYEGNTVGIQAKGHIYMTAPSAGLSARQFGVNKVLWSNSTGYWMKETHTATLSEAISAQPNGIVLVWSWYDAAVSITYSDGFTYNFIPKWHVAQYAGTHTQIGLVDYNAFHNAKVLTINDTSIIGSSHNYATYTKGGVTTQRQYWVLRYVLGV